MSLQCLSCESTACELDCRVGCIITGCNRYVFSGIMFSASEADSSARAPF